MRSGRASAADFTRHLHSTLNDIARYTVDGQEDELATFRDSMLALASGIQEQVNSLDLETCVSQAMHLFRDYNARNLQFNQARVGDLKAVMRTMTETITYLSESRTRSVHNLQFMQRELEQASQIDDIRLLRSRIINCLDIVREETVRIQSEEHTRSQEVREQIGKAAKLVETPPTRFGIMDTVTGLPSRRGAEKTIGEALQSGSTAAVAVFVVTRLSAINAKYGRAVGDEVMLRVANHFAQHLSSDTLLYRWSGPALVALIKTHNNEETIKRAWSKAAGVKQEISLDTPERTVFVIVETATMFWLVNKENVAQDLFNNLDTFIAAQCDSGAESG